ncbi:hypothetical protein ACQP3R_22570 [Bacillus inaquosorum]|uniref:hypothetical protein n=1 Tax=Bacillus inaquosorum TaxID=483913 RepID=UPI003D01A1DC
MIGMDRRTGRTISGLAQLASRMQQVLTTVQGSRVRRRGFGGDVPAALAQLVNPGMMLTTKAAMFDALANNASVADFTATKIQFQATEAGLIVFVSGSWNGSDVTVPVPIHD